jgi:hypothetical protein
MFICVVCMQVVGRVTLYTVSHFNVILWSYYAAQPVHQHDKALLALYRGQVRRSENAFLTFEDSYLLWDIGLESVYYQEWYTEVVRKIDEIWSGPVAEVEPAYKTCQRTYEVFGSAGTGKTIGGLVLINEIGKYADPPDILYVRRKLKKEMQSDEPAMATLLYKDYWGNAHHKTESIPFGAPKSNSQVHELLSLRQPNRKLFVLVDTFWPTYVLDSLYSCVDPAHNTVHMCVYIASYDSRTTAREPVHRFWPFKHNRLVSRVRKSDYLKFGYACAANNTKKWIDRTVASSIASSITSSSSSGSSYSNSSAATDRREALMSFAYDVLGGSARILLRLGAYEPRSDPEMLTSLQHWFAEGTNNPSDEIRIAVLNSCAELTCSYIQRARYPTIALTDFSSLFLRQVRSGDRDNVISVAASATMQYVLFELYQNREHEMWGHVPVVLKFLGMGDLFERCALMYLYQYLRRKDTLVLTGIGRRMGGHSMTVSLGLLGLNLNTVVDEIGIANLRVNDFAVCVKDNFAMIDGICILPSSVTIASLVDSDGEEANLSGGSAHDPNFFANGRMKPKRSCKWTRSGTNVEKGELEEMGEPVKKGEPEEDEPEEMGELEGEWSGLSMGLQVAWGPNHKLGLNDDVLAAYHTGMNQSGLPNFLIMLFCVPNDSFNEFQVTDEPEYSNLLCFKFPCQESYKRKSSERDQALSGEYEEDAPGNEEEPVSKRQKSTSQKSTNQKSTTQRQRSTK